MYRAIYFALFMLSALLTYAQDAERQPRSNPAAPTTAYTNGRWYYPTAKGALFVADDRYSIAGVFTARRPARVDTVIDLGGRYVIPPFGESHNHSVEGSWTVRIANKYLRQGIFYYKNPNNVAQVATRAADYFNRPDALDVAFAHGGLTSAGSHPEPLYRNLARQYNMDPDSMEGAAYYLIPSVAELQDRWPEILATDPDWIKLYLDNATGAGSGSPGGLSPTVLNSAIALAHQFGLPATVHVESAHDMVFALAAGADEVAHLPGRVWRDGLDREDYLITSELAQEIRDSGMIVVTTTVVTEAKFGDHPNKAAIQRLQAENIQRLAAAGVALSIGTDSYDKTARDEVFNLQRIGALTDRQIVDAWIATAPRSIFPRRAIGQLRPGYEASFLVFACNPLENLDCTTEIQLLVKQGAVLAVPE
jgi:imidazolonepropionase-like amidohydrolase